MKKLVIGALSVVASMALVSQGTAEGTTEQPLKILANVDLNLSKLSIGGDVGSANIGTNAAVGVTGAWFFTNELGASLGLDFDMLSGKKTQGNAEGKTTIKANYLDIPVDFVYNWTPSAGISSIFGVGPYFGLPMQKWKATASDGSINIKSNTAFGLNLENYTTWQITDSFALGGHVFFKWDFTDLMKEDAGTFTSDGSTKKQTYYAFGIGLGAKFL